jgi:excinuclease ABC subunit C
VYQPGEAEPLHLSRHSAALRLLQYVRDEAHRFAQHYHHILRRKQLTPEPGVFGGGDAADQT